MGTKATSATFLVTWCFAFPLRAQAPNNDDPQKQVASLEQASVDLARLWIKDPRPPFRAWAADLIRRHGQPRFVDPELIGALGDISHLEATNGRETDEDRMRLIILDALIQNEVRVPESVSRALFIRYPEQAVILLKGCPSVETCAYIVDNARSDEAWLFAAEGLATPTKSGGGPIQLLQRLRIQAEVKVFDPPFGSRNLFDAGPGVPRGMMAAGMGPAGWPEIHRYVLLTGWGVVSGCTFLTGRKYPVYYLRGNFISSPPFALADRNQYTLELLAYELGIKRESMALQAHPSAQFHWTTADKYRTDLQSFVSDRQRRYAALVSAMLSSRLLTPEESERCRLNLEIEIVDRRADHSQPIPILGVGDHLK